MRFSTVAVALAAFASSVSAGPIIKRQSDSTSTDIDAVILQYALTLEHLENAFYKKALSEWSQQQFIDAGFSAKFYDDLKYVAHDEEGHVVYLEAGLTAAGAKPVQACEYSFPMTDPEEFVALASVIEGVGVSAYLGAAPLVTSKAYLTAAGAILVTEALHQSQQRNAIGEVPAANVFGTPLGFNAVYSIASGFIKSCPATNMPLPVMAYPALTLQSGLPTAQGANIQLETSNATASGSFATFVSGINVAAVAPMSSSGNTHMVEVPMMVEGQSYVFITKDNSGNLTDSNIIAGPAILEVTPLSPTFNLTIT
ncbi:related to stress response protein rds1p [Rhynchosporium graminicola]|uniref:Related to stress response protein rds1p n=1 Tax=Rhynchosporium graminicola TaxID=2792576 RepID=A0A1E1K8H8_9HELO|nr:related to stress response protein rds1p [Rhynchosporium commune]